MVKKITISGMPGASALSGGICESDCTIPFANQHSNGSPISAAGAWGGFESACVITPNNLGEELPYVQINYPSGLPTDCLKMYANVAFQDMAYTDGRYKILYWNPNTNAIVINCLYETGATQQNCDVKVGGHFLHPADVIDNSLATAYDTVYIEKNNDYALTATLEGAARVNFIAINSDGTEYKPTRTFGGAGKFDDSDMPVINCGSSYSFGFAEYSYSQGIKYTGSMSSGNLVDHSTANHDLARFNSCVFELTSPTGSPKAIYRTPEVTNCDFICHSTDRFTEIIAGYNSPSVVGCYFEWLSGRVLRGNVSSYACNTIFNGKGGPTNCIIPAYGRYFIMENCIVYGCGSGGGYIYTGYELNLRATNCLFENCTNGIVGPTSDPDSELRVLGCYFNNLTEATALPDKDDYNHLYLDGNTYTGTGQDSVFNDAANGDFRIAAGAACIGQGIFGSNPGCTPDLSTGGGETKYVSNSGMNRGLIAC